MIRVRGYGYSMIRTDMDQKEVKKTTSLPLPEPSSVMPMMKRMMRTA